MTQRVVVVGADAAGMSAAHQALRTAGRLGRRVEIVVLEATTHTSYSACGIPYWVAGDVASGDDLVARTADAHRAAGIDLRMSTTAVSVDHAARTVVAVGPGGETTLQYDDLVLATGAEPRVPGWARDSDGTLLSGVGPAKTLDDGAAWLDRFAGGAGPVVIVGGGYIGIEMAKAAVRRGFRTTLLTRHRVLRAIDATMGARVEQGMRSAGIEVIDDADVCGLVHDGARVTSVDSSHGEVPAGMVVLAMGVTPRTDLVAGQVPLGDSGGLRPDPHGLVSEGLWSAGDCCEVWHRVAGDWFYLPLGTHANKAGRALGDSLAGGSLTFDGALGTSITRFAAGDTYLEIGSTGLNAAQLGGRDTLSLVTEGSTASGYLDEADPVAIQVTAERGTRQLLGVQVVGGRGAGKRVDAAAAVLWAGGTVDDLAWMDLSYAPPFATAWEVLQVAARRVAERL